jgi:hypothetical protein
MAVLALAPLGSLIGGAIAGSGAVSIFGTSIAAATIGSAIGGTVLGFAGSFIDQTFVFPALFGKDSGSLQGPRIDDLRFMTASAGTPMHFCLGRAVRVPGQVIWLGNTREVTDEEEVGGK